MYSSNMQFCVFTYCSDRIEYIVTYHYSEVASCVHNLSPDPGYHYDTEETCLAACLDTTRCKGVTISLSGGSYTFHECGTSLYSGSNYFIAVSCKGKKYKTEAKKSNGLSCLKSITTF